MKRLDLAPGLNGFQHEFLVLGVLVISTVLWTVDFCRGIVRSDYKDCVLEVDSSSLDFSLDSVSVCPSLEVVA